MDNKAPKDIAGFDPYLAEGDCKYNPEAANQAVGFIEHHCRHVKGELAGQNIDLEKWQRDIVQTLFGWRRPDGTRRFRESSIWVPRKNGKTTLLAGIGLYMLCGDGEAGAEVYSAASSREQAGLMHSIACMMVKRDPELAGAIQIRKSVKRLNYETSDSFYRAIPCEAGVAHGFNPHAILSDEIHTWDHHAREFWAALNTGFGARTQPLTLSISTAGFDRHSLAYEIFKYAKCVRDGLIDDPYFLPVLYYAEDDEDWTDEAVWAKANPNLNVSVNIDFLRAECKKAKAIPAKENDFRQLYLNQWTEQETRFISMEKWKGQAAEWEPLEGADCFGGLDLSESKDLTAFVLLFPQDNGYLIRSWHWIPEERSRQREEVDKVPYRQWVKQGHVSTTPGPDVDYNYVFDLINEQAQKYNILEIAFDPWNSKDLVRMLIEGGIEMVKFPQSMATFTSPTKALERRIDNGSLWHDANPLLTWEASNLSVRTDPSGNIRPVKPEHKSAARIDGMVALIMALGLAEQKETTGSIYNTRGLIEL